MLVPVLKSIYQQPPENKRYYLCDDANYGNNGVWSFYYFAVELQINKPI